MGGGGCRTEHHHRRPGGDRADAAGKPGQQVDDPQTLDAYLDAVRWVRSPAPTAACCRRRSAAASPSSRTSGRGKADAVQVMTMHRAKGLEFRCVAIHGVDAGTVPLAGALTPLRTDAARHRQDQMRERSLLFVACTRARDALRISWTGDPSPFLPT